MMVESSLESTKDVSLDDKSIIGSRSHWSDDQLWKLIEADNHNRNRNRGVKNKDKFLKKVRSYLEWIEKSEGFECTSFPGRISGITTVVPRQDIIRMANYRPECLNYLRTLAADAIEVYNHENGTQLRLMRINNVNSLLANNSCTFYYITFAAANLEDYIEDTYEAKVCAKMLDWKVEYCRLKPKASSKVWCKLY